MTPIQQLIESVFEGKLPLESAEALSAIENVIDRLDRGELRVASRVEQGKWTAGRLNQEAILLYFRSRKVVPSHSGEMTFVDKVPLKRWEGKEGVRVVPCGRAARLVYRARHDSHA